MHERLELVAHLLQSPCRGAAARCAAGPHAALRGRTLRCGAAHCAAGPHTSLACVTVADRPAQPKHKVAAAAATGRTLRLCVVELEEKLPQRVQVPARRKWHVGVTALPIDPCMSDSAQPRRFLTCESQPHRRAQHRAERRDVAARRRRCSSHAAISRPSSRAAADVHADARAMRASACMQRQAVEMTGSASPLLCTASSATD